LGPSIYHRVPEEVLWELVCQLVSDLNLDLPGLF